MAYIGNDIISLKDKRNQKSFSNPRYLKKAFTKCENDLICHFNHFDYLPYLIWTCKESAYKVLVKRGLRKSFSPKKFKVCFNRKEFKNNTPISPNSRQKKETLDNNFYGNVQYDRVNISTFSQINKDYIHTIGSDCKIPALKINRGVKKIAPVDADRQSLYTRMYLIKNLAENFHVDKSNIRIINNELTCIPFVQINHSTVDVEVSLSHDTGFISFTYLFKDITL
ncbi:MAG: 4'-phosphopantetheinyl transferase superfamily protein [Bacteroidota bacterium]